ncbi:MAG: VWA domain-containing protein [Terracidiphilus sp.]
MKLALLSHTIRQTPLAALAFLCCGGEHLFAQNSAPSVRQQVSAEQPANDPTRPEIQPRLDIDRDPIPSPDPEENNSASTTVPSGPAKPGEVQKGQGGMYTLHANVDEVLLNCSVIDDKGRTVTDLNQNDFRVWEDGVPQTVNSVLHQDLPVSMGILVDNSGSMRDKRAVINVAALKLLRASNPLDTAFIVNFSDRAFLDQGFTSDLVALNRGLSRSDSQGTTAMYDAVAASADELVKHAKERKQALLIITDGADNASRLTLAQAIRRVQNLGGPVVYTIGLLFDVDQHESERAKSALESLSDETGGIAYFPKSLADVDNIADEVARDIRNQYVVDYRSTKSASLGGYRTVHVEVKAPNHDKLIVRTKKGYYAQPPQRTQQVSQAEKQ